MSYIDGYLAAVKTAKKEEYKELAQKMVDVFKEYGALRVVENWGDDVPEGKLTSFTMAVKREEDETVVFSWIEWASREARNEGMAKVMQDPRMQPDQMTDMPFDGKRMIFGGFETIIDA